MRRRDPRIKRHPMCAHSSWTSKCIPLSLHGDAVPCVGVGRSNTKSFDIYSMQGLLTDGWSKDVKIYLLGIFETSKAAGTMDAIWKVLIWSFEALASGVWPDKDHFGNRYRHGTIDYKRSGKPLAGGLKAVLWSLKADLDHLTKAYGLRHYGTNALCEWCPADRSDRVPRR